MDIVRDNVVIRPITRCWHWTGLRSVHRRKDYKKPFEYGRYGDLKAHREIYRLTHGEIPKGLLVRHKCDTPQCVNPDHLCAGTHRDNMQDSLSRGRNARSLKEQCPTGHPYDKGNTQVVIRGDGSRVRQCKACCRERQRNRRRKSALKAAA